MRRACARIADHEFWLLWVYGAPLLFASNLPTWLFATALLTIPFFWFARKIARGQWSVLTPPDLPLGLLLALGVVAVLVSTDFFKSAQLYLELGAGIALYYGMVNGLQKNLLARAVWLLLFLGMAMGVIGLLGLQYTEKFFAAPWLNDALSNLNLSRWYGRGFTPNIVAGAVAPVVPLAFAWAWTRPFGTRVWLLAAALGLTLVVVLTQSRGALLGLMLGFAVLGLWRFPRAWIVALLVGAGVVLMTLWLGPATMIEILTASDASGSAVGRGELWNRALLMLRDFPFTGIGLGTFETTVWKFYPLFQNKPGVPVPHAHNLYLQMSVDYGVGGFVAFIGLIVSTLLAGISTMRGFGKSERGWLAASLVAGYFVYLTHSFLDAAALSTKVSVVIWFMLALLMYLQRARVQERGEARP